MKAIPERLKEALAREFTQEQIKEGFKRFEWIIRVRDRGEDNQTVLNELGIELSPNSYRKYKSKLDLYGIRGLIPKKVPRRKFTNEVRSYAKGVMTAKTNGLTASQLKILLEAEFERQFSLSKTKELLKDLKTSRQAGSSEKKTEVIACENAGYLGFMEASLQELGVEEVLWEKISEVVKEKSEASEARPNYKNKDKSGRFTNPPGPFETVDSRNDINYKGHDIAKTSTHCNLGKLRELLSLPITTVNGRFNELTDSSSKTMRQAFCGFHYQPATIYKFFRELKYYDLEHVLNQTLGQFWFSVWNSNPGKTVILFVDNKLNHLYTDKNCAMGKIGSTGEVDYCMGGCYLNDQAGHFLGVHPTCGQLHLPVGAEMVLDDFQCGFADETMNMVIVSDREMRSVPHLVETKENKDYDIITRVKVAESDLAKLQDKQYHGVLRQSDPGEFFVDPASDSNHRGAIYSGTLSLRNSEDGKNYAFDAEVLDRPDIKTPLAIVNTFKENPLSPGETIIHYLNRANKQERSFCYIDRFANGKRNYGFGKKLLTEDMHKDTRDELEKQKEKIDADIAKINADEEELSAKRREAQKKCNYEKNRLKKALKSTEAKVESGDPEGYAAQRLKIEAVKDEEIQLMVEREKEKNKFSKEASDLKKKRVAAEKKAKKKDKEIEKFSGKYEKYENETQASAIMTTLSMTFISLCQWLLSTYFKWDKIGLETLIEKIFRLPGRYVDSNTERIIYLDCQNKNRNKHEQEFNRMMERACGELSRSNIKLNDGRLLRMKYLTPS
jgi:hypothetical protein